MTLAGLLAVLAATAALPLAAQQAYELTDLGTLGGSTATGAAINSSGQVVGSSSTAGDTTTHAFLYSGGTMSDLGTLGGASSGAAGINDSGAIVGSAATASGPTHATLWNGAAATDLDAGDTGSSSANGIDNVGEVAGQIGTTATIWPGGSLPAFTPGLPGMPSGQAASGVAYAVNNSGQVVGSSANGTNYNATSWYADALVPLSGPLNGTTAAYALNDSGVMVGSGDGTLGQAMVWTISNGFTVTAQTLPGNLGNTAAYGINDAGQIVGAVAQMNVGYATYATLWPSASATNVNLNTTLRPEVASANTLTSAVAINASGQVVVNGTVTATGNAHAYLLTPASSAGPPAATLSSSAVTVQVGGVYVLTWTSSNVWACSAAGSGPGGAPWSGSLATSGTQTITAGSVAGPVTAVLLCSFGNASAMAQVAVNVVYPPLSVTLSASPTTVVSGGTTTLTWSSVNAKSCTASGGTVGDGWSGSARPTSGSVTLAETAHSTAPVTLTFTLACASSIATQPRASASAKVVDQPPGASGGGTLDLPLLLLLAARWAFVIQNRRTPDRRRSSE
jgi:probable HAF family extracellular repeat protein